jgi:hypothetical protein
MSDLVVEILTTIFAINGVAFIVYSLHKRSVRKTLPRTPEELQERIRALCARGQRAQAVKITRWTLEGVSLDRAHQIVEDVAAGREIPLVPGEMTLRLPSTLHERVQRLLQSDKQVEAVAMVRREMPGLSVKNANDAVLAVGRGAPPVA